MRALVLKEIRSFFSSLIGYVVISAFLLMIGLFLWVFPGPWNILTGGVASLDSFFTLAPWVLIFLVPAITMRSFAEEKRIGTLELLMTRPLMEGQIVFAKYLGSLSLISMSLIPTLGFVWVVGELGNPSWNLDLGGIWGSYLGLFMLAATMAAIGLFVSTVTTQPLVAFLGSMLLCTLGFIGFTALGDFSLLGSYDFIFVNLGFEAHYRSLSRGLVDTRDIAYFVFVIVLFLQLSRFFLAKERGRLGIEATRLLITTAIAVVGIIAAQMIHTSFDLTAEKRHTLTKGSKQLLAKMDDSGAQAVVTCYLHGEYPAQWKRLELAIKEKLEEFADASGGNVRFQFVDIYEVDDRQTIGQNEQRLLEIGLKFTRIGYEQNGGMVFQNVWPAALITCGNKEVPVQFFMSETPQPTDAMIQGSINSLEYQLTSGLNRALSQERQKIAFIQGHGELEEHEVGDLILDLEEDYSVSLIELDGKLNAISEKVDGMKYRVNRFDLVVVAKPDSIISDKDKLILDQYLMSGGRILWMIDPVQTDLDSLRGVSSTMAVSNDLGIDRQLFDYGVRLNKDLVIDLQCAPIAFDAGPNGNQRNMQLFSWYFYTLSIPNASEELVHPISTNLDPVCMQFVSSIDTVKTDADIKKTILLSSSAKARTYRAPVRVSSSIVDFGPEYFATNNTPNVPFAVLLEGRFDSHFTDLLPQKLIDDKDFAFRAKGSPGAMVVVSDGDICRNKTVLTPDGWSIYPLGYDMYADRVVYDNKEFIMNTINYLLDESSLISVRSRAISLRKLDEQKINGQMLGWQAIALAIPLALVLIFAVVILQLRKRKYT